MTVREPLKFIRQNGLLVLFCSAYLLGLVAGLFIVARYPATSLMRLLSYSQMSIVVGFLVSAAPFLASYIVFRCSALWLLVPFGFFKAFTFMCCFAGLSFAYADAGWLIRSLLLFSDFFSVPVLLWYVISGFTTGRTEKNDRIWFCIFFVLAIRCIDCFIISPFVSKLLLF